MEEKHFIQGFNNGYILAKYQAIITNGIPPNTQTNNPFIEGFFEGKGEYDKEQEIDRSMSELHTLRNKTNDKNNEINRD